MRVSGRLFIIAALLLAAVCNAESAEPKRVLLLHSFGREFSTWSQFTKVFRIELNEKSSKLIEFHEAALGTERFGASHDERPFVDYLRTLFAKRSLDLVVPMGAPALRFMQQHRLQIFSSTPMLFAGVEQRRIPLTAVGANDAVAAISADYAAVVQNILSILPETANIAVVVGNSPNEQYWLEQIRDAVRPFENRVAFTWFNSLSIDEILKRAAALPPKSAIFFFSLSVDAAGVAHEGERAFTSVRAVANAPIFTYIDTHFGDGIVGGPLISVNDAARQAASVAMRILNEEAPSGIKTPPIENGTPKYDWRELRRWNISEDQLPPGSEIHFRQPGVWELYGWQILSWGIVSSLPLILGLILIFEHRRRVGAEVESRQRMVELAHVNRNSTAGEMSASIAHELNQPLGAILNNAEAAAIILNSSAPDLAELKDIVADIRRDDARAGDIIRRLRKLVSKKVDVFQRCDLNEVTREALAVADIRARAAEVTIHNNSSRQRLMVNGDAVQLQQVILNLAMNAVEATQDFAKGRRDIVARTMLVDNTHIEFSIYDSGPGIPEEKLKRVFEAFFTTKPEGMGMGLSICRTIVEAHGGTIWAENAADGGARFRFRLPRITTSHRS